MTTAMAALRDLGGSLTRLPLAARLAFDDIEGKYRRTILGPLWIVAGQAATIGGFVVLFSGLFGVEWQGYALYLAAGIPVWTLMAAHITDMPNAFIGARGVIESFELPWLTHIWRRSFGYVLAFLHQIVILFVLMAVMQQPPTLNMLLAIPAMLVLFIAFVGFGVFLAVVGARYRDLQPATQVAAGFLFLFTPVMWQADRLREGVSWAFQYNPLYYFITLVREPLLGRAPADHIWIVAGVLAGLAFVVGFLTFLLARRRLYHWL